jgi:signal transduction histidine kinase
MNWDAQAYTLLLLFSSVLQFTTVIILLRKKDAPGALYFLLTVISSLMWTNGYIIEVNANTLSTKFLGEQLQYFFGIPFAPVFWYAAAKNFTTLKKKPGKWELFSITIIPVITMTLLFTNESHHLIYKSMQISEYGNITFLEKQRGIWYYFQLFYNYSILALGGFYLLNFAMKSKGIFRKQSIYFLLTLVLPLTASLVYTFKIFPMDLTTVSFAFAAIIVATNIQKHGIFDLIPAARDTIVDSITNGILVLDSYNRIIDANPVAKKIFGDDDIIGKSREEIFEGQNIKWSIDESKQSEIFELTTGNSIYELLITNIEKNMGKIFTFYDITERKRNEEKLKELNSAKDKLFSIIGHDLKNPFMGLIGLSDLLYEEYNELSDDEKKHFIKEINILSGNTHRILDNLLSWSSHQTGRMDFSPVIFNINKLIEKNINYAEQQAKLKQIELIAEKEGNISVFADYKMIDTVLRNLISNSIKYTRPGGKIEVIVKTKNHNAVVSVKDNGVGIDEETQRKLFTIDSNIKSTGTSGEKGTGLGLLLCKDFIEKNRGNINVESYPDKGSTFTFTIPLSEKQE